MVLFFRYFFHWLHPTVKRPSADNQSENGLRNLSFDRCFLEKFTYAVITQDNTPKRDKTAKQFMALDDPKSIAGQFALLNEISNNHIRHCLNRNGKQSRGKCNIQHYSLCQMPYNRKKHEIDKSGELSPRFHPKGLRNRLMYDFVNYTKNNGWDFIAMQCTDWLYNGQKGFIVKPGQARSYAPRRAGPRLKRITRDMLTDMSTMLNNEIAECEEYNPYLGANMPRPRRVFATFCEKLVESGEASLRAYSIFGGVFLFSAFNDFGTLLPKSFEHTKFEMLENAPCQLSCSCAQYRQLQGMGGEELQEQADKLDKVIITGDLTCMHCIFVRKHLMHVCEDVHVLDLPQSQEKAFLSQLARSKNHANEDVQLAGKVYDNSPVKLSVLHIDCDGNFNVHFVHLTTDRQYFICQNGKCRARQLSKKKADNMTGKMCVHLKKVAAKKELWIHLLREDGRQIPVMYNDFDAHLAFDKKARYFDPDSGFWTFPAYSTYKPEPEKSSNLLR